MSALALVAVGLVMGASVAGGQETPNVSWAPVSHDAAGSMPQIHTNPGHFVSPLEPHVAGQAYADESTNWSGQIATGMTFNGMTGNWTVPTVQATQYNSASASWIGIDGGPSSPNSIIQTGTAQVADNGSTLYYAWYELFPAPPVTIGAVAPGDSMAADITRVSGSQWTVSITDTSSGASSGPISATYGGPAISAEWIEELPTAVGSPQPVLANFASTTFTDMTFQPVGTVNLSPINMVDESGNVIASAGGTTPTQSSGSFFTDTYVPSARGYWLVGSDGGIFSFGGAQFYGSTGALHLVRPVVGIVPTANHGGYWLDASDGGVFAYGNTQFYGSIPGTGLNPAGSGMPNSLNAPIVGMVPSIDDGGYFMVASDGGVFAFGDAYFAGSCPGIGGCTGSAVAVMPDATGNGYWLVTSTGSVYTFGDAPYFGAPGHGTVTAAVPTPDGLGYLIVLGDGEVFHYGDAPSDGAPATSLFNFLDPASSIFSTSDGGGYWVSSALGAVYNFGDAPNDGGMTGSHLNGPIVAATGF
ncbi:MAG TPA: G1 family glutamic endopeptidase [Acidimicrobiales bacterium]|nr:G1 family glutamic endopeptidase [Acidimicrobiales bacterium]